MNDYLQDFLDHLYDHDKSEQTIRAYFADLSAFAVWIQEQTCESFSPQMITPLDLVNYRKKRIRRQVVEQIIIKRQPDQSSERI